MEIRKNILDFAPNAVKIEKIYALKHQLTHRTIFAEYYKIDLNTEIQAMQESFWIDFFMLKSFPASRLFEKFQETLNLHQD